MDETAGAALGISHGNILTRIKSAFQRVEAAKEEYEVLMTHQKSTNMEKTLEDFMSEVEELEVMVRLASYVQTLEESNEKYKAQIKILCEKNDWIRDELVSSQQQHRNAAENVANLEEEVKHLKFLNSIKSFEAEEEQGNSQSSQSSTPDNDEFSESAVYDVDISQDLRILHNLVIQYAAKGRYDIAVPLCEQALRDLEKRSGRNDLDYATMLNDLALIYRDQKKFKEADHLLNQTLRIRARCLGEDHPELATTLNNLAVLHGKRGRYKDAEPLCKRALEIRQKWLGPEHQVVAKQFSNLALIYEKQGLYDEAGESYKRALHIYLKALGSEDLNVSRTMSNLSAVYVKQRRYEEAETLYKQILSQTHEQKFGRATNSGGNNKPIWLIAEEFEAYKHARGISLVNCEGWQNALRAVENPAMIPILKNLSTLYRRREKHRAAEALDQAVAMRASKQVRRFLSV